MAEGEETASEMLSQVLNRVQAAATKIGTDQVRLVAVSKTKPVEQLKEVFDAGQRHFGENYVQELIEKAPQLPDEIKWHFIGHLQSNKVKNLLKAVPNLHCVESVDSAKLAATLNKVSLNTRPDRPLNVMVQVNTSQEESKSGVGPTDFLPVVKTVLEDCENLNFLGLMTIGAPGDVSCFDVLVKCRDDVCSEFSLHKDKVELSMGMSGDFEEAIMHGSNNVRVGSLIFGKRAYTASRPPAATGEVGPSSSSAQTQ